MTAAALPASDITTVLVVDDSAFARQGAIVCLRSAGLANAEFVEAGHGREALDRMRQRSVDLVVTDLNMPEMGGLELLRAIKGDSTLRTVDVVVVSSVIGPAAEAELMNEGARRVVKKPLSGAGALKMLSAVIQGHDHG
ncbi:MAG: response regulator [Myxococcales bacterium FL481]|nr:MAG: response regulator [Myxococcales bacterium FL481]